MTITTEQAIALAREVYGDFSPDELAKKHITAFANAVRKQTLLEAADWYEQDGNYGNPSFVLRQMAEEKD